MTGIFLPKEMISPEEAMKLFEYSHIEEMLRAKTLYDEYRKSGRLRNTFVWDILDLWDIMSLLSFVYDTGRVQGIREERAKSK